MTGKRTINRRGFLGTTGATAGAVVAASAFPHPAIGDVRDSNEKINFAMNVDGQQVGGLGIGLAHRFMPLVDGSGTRRSGFVADAMHSGIPRRPFQYTRGTFIALGFSLPGHWAMTFFRRNPLISCGIPGH